MGRHPCGENGSFFLKSTSLTVYLQMISNLCTVVGEILEIYLWPCAEDNYSFEEIMNI